MPANKFGAPKNSIVDKAAKKVRDAKMVNLVMQGKTKETIAKECNISVATVRNKLPELLDKEGEKNADLIRREMTLQLGILHNMLEKALTQFDKSCQASLEVEKVDEGYIPEKDDPNGMGVTSGKTSAGKLANPRRSVRTKHTQNLGDPRFLAEARQIMADRRKLLGMDQEEIRTLVINQFFGNNNEIINNQVNLSMEETEEMVRLMSAMNIGVDGLLMPPANSTATNALPEPEVIEGEYDS